MSNELTGQTVELLQTLILHQSQRYTAVGFASA